MGICMLLYRVKIVALRKSLWFGHSFFRMFDRLHTFSHIHVFICSVCIAEYGALMGDLFGGWDIITADAL